MEKLKTWKSVVLWSIISAAFIGPGTVTTSVAAGSTFGLDLLWAATFATLACIVIQEVAARITIASGLNVGQVLAEKLNNTRGKIVLWIIGGSVVAGCAAYQAGNIMGAVSGMYLLTNINEKVLTAIITGMAFLLLWKGSPAWIYNLMMFLVVVMAIAFTVVALMQDFSILQLTKASVVPAFPRGGELLMLGLVGTTVVPYNIFLGSGISKGQTVPLMRIGLTVSVLLGGLITGAILIAGTAIRDFSSFTTLYHEFDAKVGKTAAVALALGLFAAGFSCVITSPFASAIIARTVFNVKSEKRVKVVWIGVLLTGFIIGISGAKPIPVILLVQALNGLILPFLVIFLILIVNDKSVIAADFRHGILYNVLLIVVLGVIMIMSLSNIDTTISDTLGLDTTGHLISVIIISFVVVVWMALLVFKKKNESR